MEREGGEAKGGENSTKRRRMVKNFLPKKKEGGKPWEKERCGTPCRYVRCPAAGLRRSVTSHPINSWTAPDKPSEPDPLLPAYLSASAIHPIHIIATSLWFEGGFETVCSYLQRYIRTFVPGAQPKPRQTFRPAPPLLPWRRRRPSAVSIPTLEGTLTT